MPLSEKAGVSESLDALLGARAIAEFVYGNPGAHKKIYHLAERGELPVFRLGSIICARKSAIMAWIESQERTRTAPSAGPVRSTLRSRGRRR